MGTEINPSESISNSIRESENFPAIGPPGEPEETDRDPQGPPPVNPSSSNPEILSPKPVIGQNTDQLSTQSRSRILVVDDEVAIADTLAMILALQRYDARVAYSAEQAIEILSQWRPDIAILDVVLPGMNGIDLAIVTRANHPSCGILLFSGHSNTGLLLEEAAKKGYRFEVLAKPVHPELILERIAELLSSRFSTLD
jgi:CheY-like chemotaxis protein